MLDRFINRPVFSTVISVLIVILGLLGLLALPVTSYPDIAPPTVVISASYTGANAETVMRSVVVPIEEQVNGVEGMTYMTSKASNDGSAQITVYFAPGTDPDIAAVQVQNRVSRATPLLPSEVTRAGVTTQKQQTSALIYMGLYSENPNYDETFLQNYAELNIIPELKRINGVGSADVFGAHTYAMRIWLNPAKLDAYKLTPQEVMAAIQSQSMEAAAGTLGQNSDQSFEYIIRYKGKFNEVKEYKDIIVKALGSGQYLRLKDVATVELDALSYVVTSESNGNPMIGFGVMQTPGSNARDIIEEIKGFMENAEKDLPEGIHPISLYDTSVFLEGSIDSVIETLIEAFILVFIVVFVFLQDLRSTIIPAIAVPVSIIGTFFFLNILGYSMNLLTLFALVLAIGIVVDDAIVVVEAVHAKLEHGAKSAKRAASSAMHEISGAIISITIVMAAVFLPVTFITGPTGIFYKQFGVTLAIAIFISAVNALTLSPALCGVFLKPMNHDEEYEKRSLMGKFFYKFNVGFNAVTKRYAETFLFFIRHRWVTVVMLIGALVALIFLNKNLSTGFVPNEDQGVVMFNAELPAGASLERTKKVVKEFRAKAAHIPGVKNITTIYGMSMLNGAGSNYAMGFFELEDFEKRNDDESKGVEAITGQLFGLGATIADAQMIFFAPPTVPGYGASAGFQFSLTDKSGGELSELAQNGQQFMYALFQRPEIQYASTSFNTSFPQYQMDIDVPKAMDAGVSVSSILGVLQGYIGGYYATDFSKYGKQYRVMVQASPEFREDINSLNQMFVKTASGEMSPISQYVTLKRVYGPQFVSRFNMYQSADFTGAVNPGYSTGDAIKAIEETAAQMLPNNYEIKYSGLTREEVKAGSQTILIFILSLIFVYFILSALYESYIVPFSVILSLPFGVMGAYFGQWLFGLENNIYFQISLIMLIGLLAKNAILIVEFATLRRHRGESVSRAAINAAKSRLRPILMTAFAFIFAMIPLMISSGMGANGNHAVATGAAFGLLIGTAFGIIVIPVLFVIFQLLQERIKPVKVEVDLVV